MNARVSLPVLALAAALVTLGCASGDGVPKAQVRNETDMCLVEAAWFDDAESAPYGKGYYFINPILNSGQTEAREVLEGTGYAYAVLKPLESGKSCYDIARAPGGDLWVTRDKVAMSPGKTTMIVFSDANARKLCDVVGEPIDPANPSGDKCPEPTEKGANSWRFPRLTQ